MSVVQSIVDWLPAKLWRPANLYVLPGGSWHFCQRTHVRLGRPVRTVEWRGRELAHGRKPMQVPTDDHYDMGEFVPLFRGWGYYPGHG